MNICSQGGTHLVQYHSNGQNTQKANVENVPNTIVMGKTGGGEKLMYIITFYSKCVVTVAVAQQYFGVLLVV